MAAATQPLDTKELSRSIALIPVAAATVIFAGTLVAISATGYAVPAANTTGLKVAGRAEQTIDNSAGGNGALSVQVKRGIFSFKNSATAPLVQADYGKVALVEDNTTVTKTAANNIKAGAVVYIDAGGVWVDTDLALTI